MEDRGAPVLVTGASGYVGGRLVPRLLDAGYPVRCYARSPRKLGDRPWASDPRVTLVRGDVADPDALRAALSGCRAAYYLVHSMIAAREDYARRDRELARTFAHAAAAAGVPRIIYLGGLGETGADLSRHLASRREVESALAEAGVPITVLRAAMIIGSGSASFEILRYLVERLPVMVTPRWVSTPAQPIGIRDALFYLVECLRVPETAGRTLDIGGPDVVTYREIIDLVAEVRGLRRRRILPVPVLTPHLSSLWIHLVTPVSRHIARPLADGLRNPVVCRNDDAVELMPHRRLTVREAVEAALGRHAANEVETAWTDAGAVPGDPDWAGGTVFVDRREVLVRAAPERTFETVCRLGGEHGWYEGSWLWRVRGAIDRVLGRPRAHARAEASRADRVRRGAGLLARDGAGAGAEARAARGDEAAGRGAPRACRGAGGRRRLASRADGAVPAARARGDRLLVGGHAVPRAGVPRHAARHPPRGGAAAGVSGPQRRFRSCAGQPRGYGASIAIVTFRTGCRISSLRWCSPMRPGVGARLP